MLSALWDKVAPVRVMRPLFVISMYVDPLPLLTLTSLAVTPESSRRSSDEEKSVIVA